MSQSEDAYAPEEPTSDIPMSLLDIQMPETPDSTKGQTSDGDTSRLESPKILKPVLGKLKAKKRLMAFANKFNVPSKIQNKSNQAHSTKISKSKSMSSDSGKSSKNDSVVNVNSDSVQYHNRHSSGGKSKKKTEEKILAIEEIRREESKSKMLLAEAMAAASLEEETYANRNGQNLLENEKIVRERNRQDDVNVSYKSASKSTIENKYSGRRRYGREERRDNTNRESKDYNGSKERYYKVSRNKEQRRKDRGRKVNKDKREDSNKYEENRDRRDEERDKKNSDKWEDVREKKGIKEKRESFKDKRNDSQEKISEIKERKEKERDKGKEKDIMNSSSWVELKKCGITIDDIIETRRYDHSERTSKNRTAEDYLRHFEQMLMMNDCRLKRYAFIAEGLEGPKEYPPESIKVTKRGRPQLFYSENPRMSLFMSHQQILQTITIDHREKMRNICEGDYTRNDIEETEKPQHTRNWYPKTGICKSGEITKWHVPINVQLPRSKWDSEDEDKLSDTEKQQENEVILSNVVSEQEPEEFSPRLNTIEEDVNKDKEIINEDETSSIKKIDDNRQPSPLLQSAGNEKLASEYEQFMKMVCNDIPISKEFSPKLNKPASALSYHEFNIETNSSNDNNFSFVDHNISGKLDESESSNKIEEKFKANENRQNLEKVSKVENDQAVSSSSSHIQARKSVTADGKTIRDKTESEDSKSIPSDWENVPIKVERMSDENSDSKETRKKKRRKKTTSSSSESSSSSSSSDSEEETRKKRKRKISNDSDSLSDSDSSDTSTSSSDSSSSDDKRKKRKKKKRKAEKRKKKAKRIAKTKKKRRRKMSSNSSSSDSSQDRKKKRIVTKKSKQKKESSNKQDNREDIVKTIQKSPLESSSLESAKLIRSQVPLKKIKEEVKIENRKRTTDKHDIWSKEQDMVRKVISDSDIRSKTHKDEEKRNKVEERYLEEWEMDSVIIPQKGEKLSKSNVEKVENTNVENIRKIEGKDERTKKDERSKHDEHFKEKCSSISKEIIPGSLKIEEDIDGKKKRKRDKEKKSSSEFLAEWEKESERISQQIMQDEMKLSKKLDKQKKEKWGETEFDTLNVPSLTQLEREVSSRQLLADEWEVDSLEAVPDLMINKKKTSRTSKKLEKEVRYDKKTDMYITIEKETLKECKKRQDRLSAMRIWEEEQEEGEKEAMMLLEQKNKRKRDDWDIEEESFLREKSDRKESIEDNIAMIDSIHKEVNIVNKNVDTSMKHDVITRKKSKKSRWDMASQSEEKIEFKAPVMWEEECTEWTKGNKFDHNIVSLEHCDSILPNTKIRDETVCMIEQQLRKSTTKNSTSSDIIDLFPRKSQDIDLLESSWTAEEHTRSKSRIRIMNSSQEDVYFDKTKELTPSKEQLKDIFEMDMKLAKKNTELYSPSSPAGSQKSENIEVFKNNHTNSLNLEENFLHDKPKNETVVKSDDESVPNIPLQIKYCDGKYAKSVIKEEFEEILGVKKTEDQTLRTKFDMKASENSPELSIKEPYPDMNYKSLRMDIFTGYESDELRGKLINKSSETVSSSASTKVTEETNEGKAALKLIPKQLLVRRNNERVKTKLISDDPMQHAAALLTIQKKLRESHAVKNDIKDASSCEKPSAAFKIECEKATSIHAPTAAEVIPTEQTTITDVKVDSKDLSITVKTSITTKSESPGAVKLDFNEYKSGSKGTKLEELKKSRPRNSKDISDIECRIRSPGGEQKKKSPSRKENREDKRISDRNKEKRDKKFDEKDRGDRRDNRGLKLEYNESRRRSSPSGSRSKKSISWEREGSRSESHSRSWSRSRSKSPKRKDELFASSSKEKRLSRIDEDRCSRSRIDDRRERPVRSPHRSSIPYNKDHFKKHGTTKGDRDEWNRRKYDFMEREKESRSYEPIEVLRERNVDFDKHRESRFREDEADRLLWPYEAENMLRDGNESLDSYPNSQDLDLDYEEKSYYRDDNIERDIMEGPFRPSSKFKHRKSRPAAKRNRQWEKEREPLDLDRHGHVRRTEKLLPSRGRSPPRARRSPRKSSHERFRHESRSRSKSWSRSRSRSRSRSTSRSRSMMRSRSRSRSGSRSRTGSTSESRMRTPDHFRMTERLRSSRSPSMGRGRISESSRERKDEHDSMKLDSYIERGRRIETIVQSVSGLPRDSTVLDSEMHIGDNMETIAAGFQYSAENEVGNEYYYTENNLTYPPCIDDSTASSPKRLSLDDRLELELGIKKQQDGTAVSNDYGESFNSNVCYPSSPQQQQQQLLYRQQPTVLQVGNVLQVVPADFNGVPATHREPTNSSSTPIVRGSSQVVRVGNVLQVVPTSLDWSGGQPSSVDQSGMIYSTTVPQSSPVSSVPMSVPVPVPVPMPVPAVPSAVNSSTPVSTLSPLPLSVPVPVPGPVPLPVTQTTFSRTEVTPQRVPVLPVYNYEVILETRRKEREERKRLREIKRKEKERRRIERINRRALQLLEKNNMRQSESTNQQKSSALDPSVLKALRESEEQCDVEEQQTSTTVFEKEEEMTPVVTSSASTEEEEVPVEEDEEEEEEEEAEVEDDEEEEEEAEDDEEEEEEDDEKSRLNKSKNEVDETTATTPMDEMNKIQIETESKGWPELLPPPLKGILVASGFRRTSVPNGNLDDLSTPENDSGDNTDKEGTEVDKNESNKDETGENKPSKLKIQTKKTKLTKQSKRKQRSKKSVQFADGIKPGEGTSPSGGEGDMPSPPPPISVARSAARDVRRSSSRKSRKQEKRTRPPKTKKKVKVKIIKLKKPRVTPLTAMMMDDSDELDDRSPPPPPPGSPPPPHLWPSYLSAYNRTSEAQSTATTVSSTVQAPPPPTPLPLLVPPPPLNYTIQPCSKA